MALSNTAVPRYYGQFREAVLRGEIPVCKEVSMEMNRIDDLIANPGVWYDDEAVEVERCTILEGYSTERMLLFDEDLMSFSMGHCIALEDTNGNRKLLKRRYEEKIDNVSAMMDAYVAYKNNKEAFE